MKVDKPTSEKKHRKLIDNLAEYKAKKRYLWVTEELLTKIYEAIAAGGTRTHSAEAHGITYRYYKLVLEQAETDLSYGDDNMYTRFYIKIRNFELRQIQDLGKKIEMCPKGHDGAQWTLEKFYPQEFGNHALLDEIKKEFEVIKTFNVKDNLKVNVL